MEDDIASDLLVWVLKVVIAVEIFVLGVLLMFSLFILTVRAGMRHHLQVKQKDPEKGMVGNVGAGWSSSKHPGPYSCGRLITT